MTTMTYKEMATISTEDVRKMLISIIDEAINDVTLRNIYGNLDEALQHLAWYKERAITCNCKGTLKSLVLRIQKYAKGITAKADEYLANPRMVLCIKCQDAEGAPNLDWHTKAMGTREQVSDKLAQLAERATKKGFVEVSQVGVHGGKIITYTKGTRTTQVAVMEQTMARRTILL